MNASIGIDIGGTFTDILLISKDVATPIKVPTVPEDLARGVVDGVQLALQRTGVRPEELSRVVHGTTIGTNAVLERKGARIGIITTKGFEDTLYIGRAKRDEMYDLFMGASTPGYLCPRHLVRGVTGRMGPDGAIVDELDEETVVIALQELAEENIEVVAVSLLFSFVDPRQEQRIAEIARERFPELQISLSSRVDPRFREYERLVSTAFDAYIRPRVSNYIADLSSRIAQVGIPAPLQIMESHGGVAAADTVKDRAIGTLVSGLAGGVAGVRATGLLSGRTNLIGFDMGGTSTDVTVVVDGKTIVSDEGRINDQQVRIPSVDVHTVGAGGGSIAFIDAAGGLKVGPKSAGAVPGPACYGKGGLEPTVTDADLVLGYLGGSGLADGLLDLDEVAAKTAIGRLADALDMDETSTAWGIHRLANIAMANAVRKVSVMRGQDPRRFSLVACGGAGPLHACGVADELGITEVIVPANPGVLSAYGLLAADTQVLRWRTTRMALESSSAAELNQHLQRIGIEAETELQRSTVAGEQRPHIIELAVDARYVGQSHELEVSVCETDAANLTSAIRHSFLSAHELLHGHADPLGEIEITGVRATARIEQDLPPASLTGQTEQVGVRQGYLPAADAYASFPVFKRGKSVSPLSGPAILTQSDTTILIPEGWSAEQLDSGALSLRKQVQRRV